VALIDLVGVSGGNDLLNFLAEERPEIRRVLLSEEGLLGAQALASVADRADGVLAKPWDLESLTHTLMPESGPIAASGTG